jgi:hypothetical protein
MKSMRFCATLMVSVMIAACIRLAAQVPPPPQSAPAVAAPVFPASGPVIEFDSPVFDFGKVALGEKVHHTYYVTNTGNETLQISNVHPTCHCTIAGDWTHKVEPGSTGEIPVQFDSAGLGGQITRTIDVYSNAKNGAHKMLQLKGMIWKPIEFPATAFISIPPDATNELSTTVRIVNQTDNPVTFSNVVSANRMFDAVLKETKPGKEYDLVITAHPPYPAGSTSGLIAVNTSLAGTPIIHVTAMANLTPAVQVSPSQVYLNPRPDRAMTNPVTIIANTTNVLSLSNPKCSDSRIGVEIQPGARQGMFRLLVVVPPGFELAPGQHAEVTVESNHPRYPLIRIPIMQYASHRPVASRTAQPIALPAAGHP